MKSKSSAVAVRSFIAPAVVTTLLLTGLSAAAADPAARSPAVEERAPVAITNYSLQAFVASKGGETMVVPGLRAVVDFLGEPVGQRGDASQNLWLHGIVGTSGGFGGSGKVSAELYLAVGASYSPHPLGAIGFLYEPVGYWVTPLTGVWGAGADLRLRVWRLQLELGQRGQGIGVGMATGDIKQRRVVLKALVWRSVTASLEYYPSPSGTTADSCTNFTLGFSAL